VEAGDVEGAIECESERMEGVGCESEWSWEKGDATTVGGVSELVEDRCAFVEPCSLGCVTGEAVKLWRSAGDGGGFPGGGTLLRGEAVEGVAEGWCDGWVVGAQRGVFTVLAKPTLHSSCHYYDCGLTACGTYHGLCPSCYQVEKDGLPPSPRPICYFPHKQSCELHELTYCRTILMYG